MKLSGIVPYGVDMNPIELGAIWTKSCHGVPKFTQIPCYHTKSTKNDVIWMKLPGIVPYGVIMNPIELGAIWTKSCLGVPKFAQIYPNSLLPQ